MISIENIDENGALKRVSAYDKMLHDPVNSSEMSGSDVSGKFVRVSDLMDRISEFKWCGIPMTHISADALIE
ncbi:hypothetical protein RCJ22_00205, partial [Vibrio sp. FNV 38]|nr:hypothetical protein [Vibrio sp. FNV 38]